MWLTESLEESLLGTRYLELAGKISAAVLFLLIMVACAWDAHAVLLGTVDIASASAGEGDLAKQVCLLLLFAATLFAIILRGDVRLFLAPPVIFLPLLGWCWLSLLWAIDPGAALRRIGLTTVVVLTVSYSVQLMSFRRSMNVLSAALCCILLINWIAVALFPLAIHQSDEMDQALIGSWRGIHKEKNEAGAVLALCLIIFIHETFRFRSYLGGLVLVFLSTAFLYQTHSKTSGAVALVALVIGALSRWSYHNPKLRQGLAIVILAGIAMAAPFTRDLVEAQLRILEDPASFTGRTQVWPVLLDFFSDHPLLGAGYGSFWAIGFDSPVFQYGSGWVTTIFLAHNGYLDLLVQIGAIGLGIAVTCLVIYPFYVLFCRPLPSSASRTLICAVLAFGCLRDLLETTLLDRANPTWVVMVLMYALLFKGQVDAQLEQIPSEPNQRACPARGQSDSSCWLGLEASGDGEDLVGGP
ncbi:O-antigen ligase family protein, partial [Roseomonas sp. BN140053]|uniref:O-antigen ligase family protein n=1 Tax=Roseomonas sp. BN140053 TaxID=3391898 RepID=UPI0039ECC41E